MQNTQENWRNESMRKNIQYVDIMFYAFYMVPSKTPRNHRLCVLPASKTSSCTIRNSDALIVKIASLAGRELTLNFQLCFGCTDVQYPHWIWHNRILLILFGVIYMLDLSYMCTLYYSTHAWNPILSAYCWTKTNSASNWKLILGNCWAEDRYKSNLPCQGN
jgi:hypothetical protein